MYSAACLLLFQIAAPKVKNSASLPKSNSLSLHGLASAGGGLTKPFTGRKLCSVQQSQRHLSSRAGGLGRAMYLRFREQCCEWAKETVGNKKKGQVRSCPFVVNVVTTGRPGPAVLPAAQSGMPSVSCARVTAAS